MSKVIHNVVLNILKPEWPPEIDLTELDSGHQVCFHIAGMNLTGYTARIWVVKPSGLRVYNDCIVDGQRVIADITNQMLAEKGKCKGQIKLVSTADGLVTPGDFIFDVKCDLSGDGLESKNESTVFENLMADVMENMGIDATLTKPGQAADAAVVGRKFGELSEQIIDESQINALIEKYVTDNHITGVTNEEIEAFVKQYIDENVSDNTISVAVTEWLNAHPEATTTVQDGSITEKKLHPDLVETLKKASTTIRMSSVLKVGEIFEKPEGLPYCGWAFNNLQYDKDLNSIVFLINAAVAHGQNELTHLYMGVLNLDTYDVSIREIGNPDTLGHGFYTMGFCINSDGEYLYIDAQSSTLGKSVDKGAIWTTTDISAYDNWPESITQLSNGRYLFWADGSGRGVWYSDNDCATWTKATMSNAKYEGDFLELPDGVVMCFMRKSTNGTDNGAWSGNKIQESIVISISDDYGTTWSDAVDSTTLLEGCANIATAFYHKEEDLVEVFTSPRYPYGDTKGAIFQYIAKREDALNDKFGTPKVVAYAKALAYQDFGHIGGCLDDKGDMHLMYYDGDSSSSGSVNYKYMKASRGQVTLPLVKNGTPSIFLPCSGAEVTVWLKQLKDKLTRKINTIIISGGGTVEDPDFYVTESLKFDFDLTNTEKYDVDNGTITDTFGNTMTLTFASDGTINNVGDIKIDKSVVAEKLTDLSQFSVEVYIDSIGANEKNDPIIILSDNSYDCRILKGRTSKAYYTAADGTAKTNTKYIQNWSNLTACGMDLSSGSTAKDIMHGGERKIHLVLTGNSNGIFTVYYNGIVLDETDLSEDFSSWNNAISRGFGVYAGTIATPMYFRVYNKALTPEEIEQNYNYCKSLG